MPSLSPPEHGVLYLWDLCSPVPLPPHTRGLEARGSQLSLTSWCLCQARMVAAATNNLCEAANAAVQGHASEEKLISSAKQVAASTAQLLVACKVKADQDSEAMKRLQVSPCCKGDQDEVPTPLGATAAAWDHLPRHSHRMGACHGPMA